MTERKGKCTNFGQCNIADDNEVVTISVGDDFICPESECGRPLSEITSRNVPHRLLIAAIGGVLAILSGLGIYLFNDNNTVSPPYGIISPDEILTHLKKGDFSKGLKLQHKLQENDATTQLLIRKMNTPLKIDVKLQFQKEGNPPSLPSSIESSDLQHLTLTHKDNYRLQVTIPANKGNIYLYIYQKDQHGKIHRIFPDPLYNEVDNPIQNNQTCQIPSKNWFYLDELTSAEDSPITETVYIIASPWEAEDIQSLFGQIHQETDRNERNNLIQEFTGHLKRRNQSQVRAVFYKEFLFKHAKKYNFSP